ncbi:DHHC palmitoyltransferase-domain-containing protein [Xylaria digitata]|nr:DHHC palmitoyltransferase-domain-containing protein [Xylaria digitata]
MAFLVGSTAPGLQRLAVPFASLLISVLGYGSQWLFATSPDLEPGPLTPTQTRLFNTLLVCLWWTYWRACTVDPGRYEFPRPNSKKEPAAGKSKKEKDVTRDSSEDEDDVGDDGDQAGRHGSAGDASNDRVRAAARRRWCRKCAAPKPPRAHHCKGCGRCIPKMDHHCPWTGNCVSLQTFPHFVRFLIYTNISLWILAYFLWLRLSAIWSSRNLPAYLGPTLGQLIALTALSLTTGFTALVLGILLITTVRGWLFNTTMIEGWEIERHEAVLQRGGYEEEDWWRTSDGDADAAPRTMVDPVEFPYDIGMYSNMAQAMGTANPIYWLLPFAVGPRVARLAPNMTSDDLVAILDGAKGRSARLGVGWAYEENGLNDREGMWPPIDPEKVRNARLWRQRRRDEIRYHREQMQGLRNPALPDMGLSPEEEKEAFRRRQERDLRRWRGTRAEIMDELEEVPGAPQYEGEDEADYDFVNETYSRRSATGRGYMDSAESYGSRRHIILNGGKSGWVNADGEHLGDYGVDEDAEFDNDYFPDGSGQGVDEYTSRSIDPDGEDVPLAELIRRRKVRTRDGEDI